MALPHNFHKMSYDEISDWVNNNYALNAPIERFKMKFKYDPEQGWNQVTNNLDMFNNYDHVKTICRDDLICWLDSYHYSLMSKTELTEFLYRFANHYASVIGDGFKTNAWYGINNEKALELASMLKLDFLLANFVF